MIYFNFGMLLSFVLISSLTLYRVLIYRKKAELFVENVIVLKDPNEVNLWESLCYKILFALSIVILLMAIFMFVSSEDISSINWGIFFIVPIQGISIWFTSNAKAKGTIIGEFGIKSGFDIIKWENIKSYKWVEEKRKNKLSLVIKTYKFSYIIYIDFDKKEKAEEVIKGRFN